MPPPDMVSGVNGRAKKCCGVVDIRQVRMDRRFNYASATMVQTPSIQEANGNFGLQRWQEKIRSVLAKRAHDVMLYVVK